jgi:Fe-S-cluster containining protein
MLASQLKKKPLPVPPNARKTHKKIGERLAALSGVSARSCLEPEFTRAWKKIMDLVDRYQKEITGASHLKLSCAEGCASCCCHWVEDVNSFEAELIAEYITTRFPEKIPLLLDQCRRDKETLKGLNDIVEVKLDNFRSRGSLNDVDPIDVLLASFHRLQIPCPLLDNNVCMVYPLRPLTCRMYVSFSAPSRCSPDYTDEGDIPTYLFDLEEEADRIIDELHFKFLKFENDTGLRSLIAKYLRL